MKNQNSNLDENNFLRISIIIIVIIISLGLLYILVLDTLETIKERNRIQKTLHLPDKINSFLEIDAIGIWDFNEDSVTTAYDISDYDNHGTVYGGAVKTNEDPNNALGKAFYLDGVDDYIEIADANELSPSEYNTEVTISLWMKIASEDFENNLNGYVNFLGKGEEPDSHEFHFRIYNKSHSTRPQRIAFYVFKPEGGYGAGSYFQDSLSTGEWIHVAGVLDGTHTHIYKNGVLRDSDPLAEYEIIMGNTDSPLRIGTYRAVDAFFNGTIDEVKIYKTALSEQAIKKQYLAGLEQRKEDK